MRPWSNELLMARRGEPHHQANSLLVARRELAPWHTLHVPLGLALFTTAFIHIWAAIYYATLTS